MPRDEMPPEMSSDTSPYIRDVLIQFKDVIQVKVNTDEVLQKLVEKVQKLEEKLERNKTKEVKRKNKMKTFKENVRREIEEYKMELRLELQNKVEKLEENIENQSKQNLSLYKEDPKKELDVKEETNLGIQEEMQKELCAKVHHYNGSSSLRSQPHQSQTTTYHLEFACQINTIVYKGKPMRTSDSDHIHVVLYNGDYEIEPDHYLASATVELVVLYGEFSGQTQGYWSKDEFIHNIAKLRQVNNSTGEPPKLRVKNGRFKLVGGRYRHEGVAIMDNSSRKDVKLGAMIVGITEERVLEGVSNIFKVQEAKTENRAKRPTDDTAEDLLRCAGNIPDRPRCPPEAEDLLRCVGNNTHSRSKNGPRHSYLQPQHNFAVMSNQGTHAHTAAQGPRHSYLLQPQHNFAVMPNQGTQAHTAENGSSGQPQLDHVQRQNIQHGATQQEDYGQGHQYVRPKGAPINLHNMTNTSPIIYPHTTGNGYVGSLPLEPLQYPNQGESYGQGHQHNFPRPPNNFAVMQSRVILAQTAGNGSGVQPLIDRVQKHNTQQGATQEENHAGKGRQYVLSKIGTINFHNKPNPPGNGSVGPLLSEALPYSTQQVESSGLPNRFQRPQPNFTVMPNQVTHSHSAGNGQGVQPLIEHVQKQDTQQGGTPQEDRAGKGQQHIIPNNGRLNFQSMSNLPGTPYPCISGIGSLGPLPSAYPTQQEITQVENSGNGLGCKPLVEHVHQQNTTQQGASCQQDDHGLDLDLNQLSPETSVILNHWSGPTHVSGLSASDGLQNTFELPVEYQDGGAIGAPYTVAPVIQMDSIQAMSPDGGI